MAFSHHVACFCWLRLVLVAVRAGLVCCPHLYALVRTRPHLSAIDHIFPHWPSTGTHTQAKHTAQNDKGPFCWLGLVLVAVRAGLVCCPHLSACVHTCPHLSTSNHIFPHWPGTGTHTQAMHTAHNDKGLLSPMLPATMVVDLNYCVRWPELLAGVAGQAHMVCCPCVWACIVL